MDLCMLVSLTSVGPPDTHPAITNSPYSGGPSVTIEPVPVPEPLHVGRAAHDGDLGAI
jgi:hypothetical protein